MKIQRKQEVEFHRRMVEQADEMHEEMLAQAEQVKERALAEHEQLVKHADDHKEALLQRAAEQQPAVYDADEVTADEGQTVKTEWGETHAPKGSYVLTDANGNQLVGTKEAVKSDFERVGKS